MSKINWDDLLETVRRDSGVKGVFWLNIYQTAGGHVYYSRYNTREEADADAYPGRLYTIRMAHLDSEDGEIEIEEGK